MAECAEAGSSLRPAILVWNNQVVNCLYQNCNSPFRLVCFPWAGGGSNYFAKWGQDIPNSVEGHAIRLAGRESWLEDPFPSDIYQMVDEIACALLPVLQGENFAFFGHRELHNSIFLKLFIFLSKELKAARFSLLLLHSNCGNTPCHTCVIIMFFFPKCSMGSYVTFMTVLHLKEKYKLEPVYLCVSGVSAPHSKARLCFSEDLSEEQITCLLKDLVGIPVDFVDDKAFLQQFPKLVTDSRIVSNYIRFTGSEDIPADLEAWEDVTSGSFDIRVLPGRHFYLLEPSNEIFIKNYITKSLEVSMLHCSWIFSL
ncbi:S-acyl fatty acid synthase thioesterase, medium chain [Megaptera novaeangliae]